MDSPPTARAIHRPKCARIAEPVPVASMRSCPPAPFLATTPRRTTPPQRRAPLHSATSSWPQRDPPPLALDRRVHRDGERIDHLPRRLPRELRGHHAAREPRIRHANVEVVPAADG